MPRHFRSARTRASFTISSGGCNILNYLIHQPKRIVAVDLNANHMALTRLKLAAISTFPTTRRSTSFLGTGSIPTTSQTTTAILRDTLDPLTRSFWESSDWPGRKIGPKRLNYFKRGLYDYAKLGQFFRVVHGLAKRMGRDPAKLLAAKTIAEQEQVFGRVLRPALQQPARPLDGPAARRRLQPRIPPSQHAAMLEEQQGDGGRLFDMYKQRVRRLACGFPLDDNYFAWQAFGRRYDTSIARRFPTI